MTAEEVKRAMNEPETDDDNSAQVFKLGSGPNKEVPKPRPKVVKGSLKHDFIPQKDYPDRGFTKELMTTDISDEKPPEQES